MYENVALWLFGEEGINQSFSFLSPCFPSIHKFLHTGICIILPSSIPKILKSWLRKQSVFTFQHRLCPEKTKTHMRLFPKRHVSSCFHGTCGMLLN